MRQGEISDQLACCFKTGNNKLHSLSLNSCCCSAVELIGQKTWDTLWGLNLFLWIKRFHPLFYRHNVMQYKVSKGKLCFSKFFQKLATSPPSPSTESFRKWGWFDLLHAGEGLQWTWTLEVLRLLRFNSFSFTLRYSIACLCSWGWWPGPSWLCPGLWGSWTSPSTGCYPQRRGKKNARKN